MHGAHGIFTQLTQSASQFGSATADIG